MPFYAFQFDTLHCGNPRGKLPIDVDVVTFTVFVNQLDRGHGAAVFNMSAGETVHAPALAPSQHVSMDQYWIVGPFQLNPNDLVSVVYSGTNTSDSGLTLNTQQQDQIEIKILDAIASAAAGSIGGPVSSVITGALGLIGDPVGKLLGISPQGPCNGLVYSDSKQFTGEGLGALPYQPQAAYGFDGQVARLTFSYDDSATHNTSVCGEVAHTDVTFAVWQVSDVSVRSQVQRLFPHVDLSQGVRHGTGSGATSLRELIGLIP